MNNVTLHRPRRLSDLEKQMISFVPEGGSWMDIPAGLSARVDQIRARSRTRGLIHTTYYGRLRWEAPAYTISTFFTRIGNGCFIHPEQDRLITPREAARLQSFPDVFHFVGTDRNVAMQIGNAVPPMLAYHVAKQIPGNRVADLFAGAGGFSLGAHWSGKKTILAVESDSRAVATYSHNNPGTSVWEARLGSDSSLIELQHRIEQLGGIDILAGGPPCQSFSTAGLRADDDRSTLVDTFVKAARTIMPRSVVMENVHGLRSFKGGRVLRAALDDLQTAGYDVQVWDLHAETYGVPQRRRRLFVIGTLEGAPPQVPEAKYPRFRQGRYRGIATECVTVRDAISDMPAPQDADEVILRPSRSPYQAFLRGELSVRDGLASTTPSEQAEQLRLAI